MAEEVEIEALRPFNRTPQGAICEAGDRFKVTPSRAGELELLGLARRTAEAAKPENKMLPDASERRTSTKRQSNPNKD